MDFYSEIIGWVKEEKPDKSGIAKKKKILSKKYDIKIIPTDISIYLHAGKDDAKIIRKFLQTKPMRTGSGVAVIATMTKPINCPHGSCIYCPGGLKSFFGDVPKSYTGKEPSTMRGIRNEYDPYRIIFNRLEQYIVLGQNPDKVDQIIMGGTFTAFPKDYQDEYVYYSFKAYNDFSKIFYNNVDGIQELDLDKFKSFFELPGDISDAKRKDNIKKKILELKDKDIKTLEKEQILNENAAIRCIGLTIETKPDWAFKEQGLRLLQLGTTRIELGVQTVYDNMLNYIHRGHNIKDTIRAVADLKDLGFKINFHMMPGLPDIDGKRISKDKDIESLKEIFDNPDFRPDMLKIYPCMVMPSTELEKIFKKNIFKPLNTEEAADIISEAFRYIPEYCRVMRIQRDIPTNQTTAGVDKTNLRQYIDVLLKKKNIIPRDIRAREIREIAADNPKIIVKEYEASKGKEFFISMEADDRILGFVRMRFPPRSLHPAITPSSALIRELHVYGQSVTIGRSDSSKAQHKGTGRMLMNKAEEIAKFNGKDKIVVISGVGVREYYRKLGYSFEEPYMVKEI